MREILFRGKRADNGEWVYGDLVHWWGRHNTKPDIQIYNNVKRFDVIPESIGQYTSLTANGKKIFEGDIVESVNFHFKGVVVFDEYCRFVIKDLIEGGYYLVANNNDICEVIGNIHDNPELLKGE